MNVSTLKMLEKIRELLAGRTGVTYLVPSDELARRTFLEAVLVRDRYFVLPKGTRSTLYQHMLHASAYSGKHLDPLVAQFRQFWSIHQDERSSQISFTRKDSAPDVALPAELDSCGHRREQVGLPPV